MKKVLIVFGLALLIGVNVQEVFAKNYLSQSTFHLEEYKDVFPDYYTNIANKGSRSVANVHNLNTGATNTNISGVSGTAKAKMQVMNGKHEHSGYIY